jgi:hypothetical protein
VFPTSITVRSLSTTPKGGGFVTEVLGVLTSPRSSCRSGRKVKFYIASGGTTAFEDVDRSSLRGEFGVRGTHTNALESITIKVPQRRINRGHVCAGSKLTEG